MRFGNARPGRRGESAELEMASFSRVDVRARASNHCGPSPAGLPRARGQPLAHWAHTPTCLTAPTASPRDVCARAFTSTLSFRHVPWWAVLSVWWAQVESARNKTKTVPAWTDNLKRQQLINGMDADTKRFLMAVAWTSVDKEQQLTNKPIDTSGWVLDATDAVSLATQMRDNLRKSGAAVADAIALFNYSTPGTSASDVGFFKVESKEFVKAMRERLQYRGDTAVLRQVFETLDASGDGTIDCDELFEFISGRKNGLAGDTNELLKIKDSRVDKLSLAPPKLVHAEGEEWSQEELRREVLAMLSEQKLYVRDLLRVWDKVAAPHKTPCASEPA